MRYLLCVWLILLVSSNPSLQTNALSLSDETESVPLLPESDLGSLSAVPWDALRVIAHFVDYSDRFSLLLCCPAFNSLMTDPFATSPLVFVDNSEQLLCALSALGCREHPSHSVLCDQDSPSLCISVRGVSETMHPRFSDSVRLIHVSQLGTGEDALPILCRSLPVSFPSRASVIRAAIHADAILERSDREWILISNSDFHIDNEIVIRSLDPLTGEHTRPVKKLNLRSIVNDLCRVMTDHAVFKDDENRVRLSIAYDQCSEIWDSQIRIATVDIDTGQLLSDLPTQLGSHPRPVFTHGGRYLLGIIREDGVNRLVLTHSLSGRTTFVTGLMNGLCKLTVSQDSRHVLVDAYKRIHLIDLQNGDVVGCVTSEDLFYPSVSWLNNELFFVHLVHEWEIRSIHQPNVGLSRVYRMINLEEEWAINDEGSATEILKDVTVSLYRSDHRDVSVLKRGTKLGLLKWI